MRPDLQERFLRIAHNLDRLDRLNNLVMDSQHTSPRSLIASAAVAGAEFLAAASGHSGDPGIIHRAYEEIFASLEGSEAVAEMFSRKVEASMCASALTHVQNFRLRLASGEDTK